MKLIEKSLYLTFTAIVLFCTAVHGQGRNQDAGQPARPQMRRQVRVISPEILPDNRVTFRVYSKDASRVSVSGEWQAGFGGSEDLVKNDSGMFALTVGPLKPELYGYTFTIDGVKSIDPANVQVRRDGVNYQSFFIVAGPESDLYLQKENVPHGTVEKVWYRSGVLGFDRRMYVYTPPGYITGDLKYPVFYLLHGAGGDEDAWTNMGREAQIIDNLIALGKAKPMIVVMTNGNATQAGAQNEVPALASQGRQEMSAYAMANGRFEEHLVKDVVPFVEKNYRTLQGENNRAIAGLSMGGAQTQTITNDNPGMFGYIGVFSMGIMNFGTRNQDAAKADEGLDAKIEALNKSGYKLYWIGCGKDDFVYQSVITLRNTLDKHDFRYTYRESTGGHTWANWRIYLSEFAPLLFK